jgi:hypothetical protein
MSYLLEEPVGRDEIELADDATSLDFMQAIYRDPTQPMTRRIRAAQIAIGYEHPKLAVNANTNLNFASEMEAFARAVGKSNVIDAKANYRADRALPTAEPTPTDPAAGFKRRL